MEKKLSYAAKSLFLETMGPNLSRRSFITKAGFVMLAVSLPRRVFGAQAPPPTGLQCCYHNCYINCYSD